MPPHLVRGHLDVLRPGPAGGLLVGGWCLPFEPARLEAIEVRFGDRRLALEEVLLAAPSPDIAAEFPSGLHAAHARFFARARVEGDLARDTLVEVTPILGGGRRALPLHAVHAPTIAVPNEGSVASIGGTYELRALEYLRFFVGLCGLERDGRVLDVGCGIGRMAWALGPYLGREAAYLGFDVMPDAIDTARETVGARYRQFRFECVDVANAMYRADGRADAAGFRFPAGDAQMDLVILVSVVTHLREAPARRFLSEIARVLAPGGRALVSAFVMDEDAQACVAAGRSSQPFFAWNGDFTIDAQVPEKAIAFAPERLFAWIDEAGLVAECQHAGTWCGRAVGLTYQDVLVLRRRQER